MMRNRVAAGGVGGGKKGHEPEAADIGRRSG